MKLRVVRPGLPLATAAAAILAGAGGLRAQPAGEIRLYRGDPAMQAGIGLQSWGSGEIKESEEYVLVGSHSLKLTTHGRFQGARIVLPSPVSLKPALSDPSAYLQLMVILPTKESLDSMASMYGGMAGMMGPPASMRGMMGGYGGRGGRGGRGGGRGGLRGMTGGPGGTGGQERTQKPPPLANLRVVLVTTDGKRTEAALPVEQAVKSRTDWKSLAIPVSAIKGLKDSSAEVKEIHVFGDSPAVIHIGEIRVVRDETPIRIDDLPDYTVPVNDTVTFTGSAEAGVTPLRLEWDFDATDGVNVDYEGRVARHKFRRSMKDAAGNTVPYTVTLRVVDPYGIKKPATRTTKVYVTL